LNEPLHIVCLDAPAPPNYGGAMDMFYKIEALARIGRTIILHYFDYKKERGIGELAPLCKEVHHYSRHTISGFLSKEPHIIASRKNNALIKRLNADHYPVLLEGLHCAGIMPNLNDAARVVLRMHNEEAAYYHHLQKWEQGWLKKWYLGRESKLLESYQRHMNHAVPLAVLSQSDEEVFQQQYGFHTTHFIPCFIPWQQLASKEGKGNNCLYHGNLAVAENEAAALWLIREVFSKIKTPLIIAGNGSSVRLQKAAAQFPHIQLVVNPDYSQLQALISEAHIHVLPSMNRTGVKLKLLNALFCGRFCITNTSGVEGSAVAKGVLIAEKPAQWISQIEELMLEQFTLAHREERNYLCHLYNNQRNAEKLSALC
jgi:glycosyltransferase involved in cell wall biosynthesis